MARERLPGNVSMAVKFTLTKDNVLRIEYTATTDRPTVINPSHHPLFQPGQRRHDPPASHRSARRSLHADQRAQAADGLHDRVSGRYAPDLRKPALLGDRANANHPQMRLANGYDHNFVLDKPAPDA